MEERTKTEFRLLFNQGFEEVVLPRIVEIDERLDRVESRLGSLENQVERMDRKLDVVADKVMQHEVKIKKLEKPAAVAHNIKKAA